MGKKKWAERHGEDFQNKIDAWKSKHGKVHYIETEDGKEIFLKSPNRATVAMAMSKSRNSPLALVEVIIKNCWLAGDEEVKEDPGYLVGLAEHVDTIIGTKKAKIKNL